MTWKPNRRRGAGIAAVGAGVLCIGGALFPALGQGSEFSQEILLLTLTALAVIFYTYLTFIGLEDGREAENRRIDRERKAWALVLLQDISFLTAWLSAYSKEETPIGTPPKTPLLKRALDHVSLFPPEVGLSMSYLATDLDELHQLYRYIGHSTPDGQAVSRETVNQAAEGTAESANGLVRDLVEMVGPDAIKGERVADDPEVKTLLGEG